MGTNKILPVAGVFAGAALAAVFSIRAAPTPDTEIVINGTEQRVPAKRSGQSQQRAVPKPPSQRQCYCTQHTRNAYQPYKILSYPTIPSCGSVKLELQPTGPWTYLLSCDDLKECHRILSSGGKNVTAMYVRISNIREEHRLCPTAACRREAKAKLSHLTQRLDALLKKLRSTSYACWERPLGG